MSLISRVVFQKIWWDVGEIVGFIYVLNVRLWSVTVKYSQWSLSPSKRTLMGTSGNFRLWLRASHFLVSHVIRRPDLTGRQDGDFWKVLVHRVTGRLYNVLKQWNYFNRKTPSTRCSLGKTKYSTLFSNNQSLRLPSEKNNLMFRNHIVTVWMWLYSTGPKLF